MLLLLLLRQLLVAYGWLGVEARARQKIEKRISLFCRPTHGEMRLGLRGIVKRQLPWRNYE